MAEGGIHTNSTLLQATPLDNVKDITTCSKCQYPLQDPKTLRCLHSFCDRCLRGSDNVEQDGEEGYKCNQCEKFTAEKDVRVSEFLVKLMEAEQASKKRTMIKKCERCGTKDAKWYCTDCRKLRWLCDKCRRNHDEYIDEHNVIPTDQTQNPQSDLNKPLYCPTHKQYEMDTICRECDTLICLRCKVEQHDVHKSESIADAVERITPHITYNIDTIKENVKRQRARITAIEKQKEAAITMYNKQIRQHENDVSAQNQVVAWATTAMVKTRGASFFRQFQGDLSDTIKRVATQSDFRIQASRLWPWDMKEDEPRKSIKIQLAANGDYPFTRITILLGKIWMINHNTGTVLTYDFNGEEDGEFQLDESIIKPRTAVEVYSNQAVIAAQSGLHLIDVETKEIISTHPGDFSDVCFGNDGLINALEYKQGHVYRMRNIDNSLWKIDEIHMEKYTDFNSVTDNNYVNTLLVTDEHIFIAFCYNYRVVQYAMSGQKLKIIASSKKDLTYPHICGAYNKGAPTMLITNLKQSRIECWDEENKLKEFRVHGRPWFAVAQNENVLWVLSEENELQRYVYE